MPVVPLLCNFHPQGTSAQLFSPLARSEGALNFRRLLATLEKLHKQRVLLQISSSLVGVGLVSVVVDLMDVCGGRDPGIDRGVPRRRHGRRVLQRGHDVVTLVILL